MYSFSRKSKRGYYDNLNIKNVTDNKLFWKSVKFLLSNKSRIRDRINLKEWNLKNLVRNRWISK